MNDTTQAKKKRFTPLGCHHRCLVRGQGQGQGQVAGARRFPRPCHYMEKNLRTLESKGMSPPPTMTVPTNMQAAWKLPGA